MILPLGSAVPAQLPADRSAAIPLTFFFSLLPPAKRVINPLAGTISFIGHYSFQCPLITGHGHRYYSGLRLSLFSAIIIIIIIIIIIVITVIVITTPPLLLFFARDHYRSAVGAVRR